MSPLSGDNAPSVANNSCGIMPNPPISTVIGSLGDNSPLSTITPNVVEQSISPSYANILPSQIELKPDKRDTWPLNLKREPLSISSPPLAASKSAGDEMPEEVIQPPGFPIKTSWSKANHSPETVDSTHVSST